MFQDFFFFLNKIMRRRHKSSQRSKVTTLGGGVGVYTLGCLSHFGDKRSNPACDVTQRIHPENSLHHTLKFTECKSHLGKRDSTESCSGTVILFVHGSECPLTAPCLVKPS